MRDERGFFLQLPGARKYTAFPGHDRSSQIFQITAGKEQIMSQSYNPKAIEKKWQQIWEDEKAFAATDD